MGGTTAATVDAERSSRARVFAASCAVVLLVASLATLAQWVNVHPNRANCENLRQDDDIVHLAQRRSAAEATAQLRRWDACDAAQPKAGRSTRARARATVGPGIFASDHVLIVALTIVLLASALAMSGQIRWRLASRAGVVLAVVYAVADWTEDSKLATLLGRAGRWSPVLPIASAFKFGAILAALPLFFGAVFVLLLGPPPDDMTPEKEETPGTDTKEAGKAAKKSGFSSRWRRRFSGEQERVGDPAPTANDAGNATTAGPADVGICCSGGGIRSAAFTLGALQALAEPPEVGTVPDSSEYDKAGSIYSVSGGSYMAAGWVTARNLPKEEKDALPAWSRQSPEEKHLRRNASYLAPGLGGKAKALLWFLLAFGANAGLVVLTIGALCLPLGWAIHVGFQPKPVEGGELTLPSGGCVERDDGSFLNVVGGTKLTLVAGSEVTVVAGAVVAPQPKPGSPSKATATAEGAPPAAALAVVGGAPTTTTSSTAPGAPIVGCTPAPSRRDGLAVLPANAPGRLLEKGSGVPIDVGPKVYVHGTGVAGCVTRTVPATDCGLRDASVQALGGRSRLLAAPNAVLTLDGPAIVSHGATPRLEQACDGARCERFRLATWLAWIPRALVGLLALSGVTLVTMRQDTVARGKVQNVTTWLAIATGVVAVLLWWLPQLILLLTAGRSWLATRARVATGAGTGTLAILLTLLTQLRAASGKSTAPTGRVAGLAKALGGRLRPVLVRFVAILVGPALVAGVALAFAAHGADLETDYTKITLGVVLVGWLVVLGSCGDLNRWSLHAYYRDRLTSAFAFDIDAGRCREDLLESLPDRPELVLCATANLADNRITPPGRPAVPWVFSKNRIGSPALSEARGPGCYPPSTVPPRFKELRWVWTSVAVSGAAFSPAMGKMSRPERFLFALGNLRLGVWYPNPRYLGAPEDSDADFHPSWYDTHHPRPWYFFKEALGLHKLRDPWVYVTDGGHYENLGLVQLLSEKRSGEVYCFDAAGDATSTFGTLADAMRLAREEHGIEITLDPRAMKSDADGISRLGIWAGTVTYPEDDRDDGWLVVAKLTVPEAAPFDIIDLARTLPSFPTNPTADQLYTDQKFEAYRALGDYLGREAAVAGRKLRALIADGVTPGKAVSSVNGWLCSRTVPEPCPPPAKPGARQPTAAT